MRYQYLQRALAAYHVVPPPVRGCVSPYSSTSGFPDPQMTSRCETLDSHSPLISLIY
jgi:hypothetical protein